MAWLACNMFGVETISEKKPIRREYYWDGLTLISLPKGSIRKLIGRELSFEDEPVEL